VNTVRESNTAMQQNIMLKRRLTATTSKPSDSTVEEPVQKRPCTPGEELQHPLQSHEPPPEAVPLAPPVDQVVDLSPNNSETSDDDDVVFIGVIESRKTAPLDKLHEIAANAGSHRHLNGSTVSGGSPQQVSSPMAVKPFLPSSDTGQCNLGSNQSQPALPQQQVSEKEIGVEFVRFLDTLPPNYTNYTTSIDDYFALSPNRFTTQQKLTYRVKLSPLLGWYIQCKWENAALRT